MKRLDNMTVRLSWSLVLALFSVLVITLGGLGLYAARHSETVLQTLNEVNVDQQAALNRTNTQMLLTQLALRDLQARLLDSDVPQEREAVQDQAEALESQLSRIESSFQAFLALPGGDKREAMIDAMQASFIRLLDNGLRAQQQALTEGDVERFQALAPDVEQLTETFYNAAVDFFVDAERSGASLYADFTDLVDMLEWLMIVGLVVAAGSVVVVLWGVTANVIRPLSELVGYFERMQQGNLAQRIPKLGNNEIGRLYAAMSAMQQGLADTVSTVRDSSNAIYLGTQSIAHGNNDLSARTEQQASSLQETASSMEQLSSTVTQNADNAGQASQLAANATQTARQGGSVVNEVVSTMHDISQSSQRIATIIGTIDSIAFQTNILALNASVEAARAGEHGKGFAVVAQEVGNLAKRSGDAAHEIRGLIEASASQVERGTTRADQAGKTMEDIVTSVQRVSDIMDEIASASSEQSSGIGQVNEAVTQMDQVTQQNAGLVQSAASAANQLEAEASRLKAAVNRFRLESSTGAGAGHTGNDMSGDELSRWMPSLADRQPSSASPPTRQQQSQRRNNDHDDEWESF
ncbi:MULTISPECIES: methyl-accepting chemotaxis protein [unclassified Halomonas]|uniref:methyl-accepting chemotaxis protein n=1 Tax=unclassified Halomonas TaxID=2609666 RepID=UPI0028880C3E|nr:MULTISPECIES: methyl-accepting chemotaxis protein [unclassified Halomonas]MDT0500538.1 methyl-accepting chemotaxis protein [Halomonas sp. PAR7]MDT0511566.1 methyl-accepting chemotaxis protein [Halomonas sp. LES1]MDT0590146.1 methyl-accepting chemotaxis protein [Halomonas sp. PAR8]